MSRVFLMLAWPVSCIHHLWNHRLPCKVSWFLLINKSQDIQWYIADTGRMLAVTFILAACYLLVKRGAIKWLIGALALISIIDIIHYWLYFSQAHEIILLQGIMMIAASIKAFLITCKNI